MKRLQVLLLTASILLPASSLRAQIDNPEVGVDNAPVVCNDGTLKVNVVRAFKDTSGFFNQWVIQGWYFVRPGECGTIGPVEHYVGRGVFWEGSVTLLAFAFDSIGAGGGR